MKKLIFFCAASWVLSSCDVIIIEPTYDQRATLLGSYSLEEYSQTYGRNFSYPVYISRSSFGSHYVAIDNFYDQGISVRAEIRGNKIYLPLQTVSGYQVEGSGNIFTNEITLTYRIRDIYRNSRADFCEARLF